jgi:hypothetical protein
LGEEFFMREERLRQAFRLRQLTLVLALALTWYAVNPAPGSMTGTKSDGRQPDEKCRKARSLSGLNCDSVWTEANATEAASDPFLSAGQNIDDLEWPEVIDVR